MELKYEFLRYGCLVVLFVFIPLMFVNRKKKYGYQGGKKIASLDYIKDDPAFKNRIIWYRILTFSALLACIAGMVVSLLTIARPYEVVVREEEKYSRDIILCLDVSTSVDDLNQSMISRLKETVRKLEGERIGIVIFNTSPALLCPLTDDYAYVLQVLDEINAGLKARNDLSYIWRAGDEDVYYSLDYISSGTLIGNEERGSSLIGDGLASAAYCFSNLDEERTRIVIFTTDNEVEGAPLVTLDGAADVCVKNNVVVYGIGTSRMQKKYEDEMRAAVQKTGGKYYRQNESGSMQQIVDDISLMGENLVKGNKEVKEVDHPEKIFLLLIFATGAMLISSKIVKI